ncbi:MAG: GntR family transcriptional regulator, partial [bacterium]|nr:GntR family transcriptional regulator [bacterium]
MKVKDSKWVRIYEALVEEIKTGRYNKGERLFTRQELCERFGVSDIVVRRALDELRREGLIINKPRVGVIVAKNLEIEEIRVFVGDVWDRDIKAAPFTLLKIISGIEEEARSYGIRIQYINSRTLAGIYGDVIISFYDFLYNHIADYKGNNTYIILHPPKRLSSHHTVRHGLFEGGYIATKHLISRGYKKIGYIGSLNDDWYIARFQGCLEALKEDNLGIPMEYLKEVGEDKEEVCNAIESLLKLKHP